MTDHSNEEPEGRRGPTISARGLMETPVNTTGLSEAAGLRESRGSRFFRLASSGCTHDNWDWVDPAKTGIADHWKCLDCGIDSRDGDAFLCEHGDEG